MRCVVFYSWQSDLPNCTNRGFIQRALENAAKAIRDDETIQVEPVIDRDTAGVPGSPDIAHTIFEKIEQCWVFVCDVSLINNDVEQRIPRPTPNPNVLLELGYALKVLGPNRVLMVINTAYGKVELLPFDLRTKRVITYQMPKNNEERAQERKKLEASLEHGLRAILQGAPLLSVGEEIQPKSKADQAIEAIEGAKPNQANVTRRFMEDIAERIDALAPDLSAVVEDAAYERLIQAIDQSQSLTLEVARVSEVTAAMNSSDAALAIYKGFGRIAEGYNNKLDFSGTYSIGQFDFHKFIGHELFVTFFSFLVKEQRWDIISELLDEELNIRNINETQRFGEQPYTYLSQYVWLLEKCKQPLGLRLRSLHADLLNQRHTEGKISELVPIEQFIDADYFLFLRATMQEGRCGCIDWKPWSSPYMGRTVNTHVPSYLTDAVRLKNAEKLLRPLGVKDIESLKKGLAECASKLVEFAMFWDHHPLQSFDVNSIGSR